MGYKRGYYMTKKKKRKFNFDYNRIKWINNCIINLEAEKETLIKNEKWDEVEAKEKYIYKLKNELYQYGKAGYDIFYGA